MNSIITKLSGTEHYSSAGLLGVPARGGGVEATVICNPPSNSITMTIKHRDCAARQELCPLTFSELIDDVT